MSGEYRVPGLSRVRLHYKTGVPIAFIEFVVSCYLLQRLCVLFVSPTHRHIAVTWGSIGTWFLRITAIYDRLKPNLVEKYYVLTGRVHAVPDISWLRWRHKAATFLFLANM